MNNRVGRIARKQTHIGGFTPFPSPSSKASTDEDNDASDDQDDASSLGADEMTTSH